MRPAIFVVAAALLAAACTGETPTSGSTSTTAPPAPAATSAETAPPATTGYDRPRLDALQCDPLDERACLLPWPNDAFTVPDASTDTGRRLALDPVETPRNRFDVPIDVTDQNRADGFSPASTIITFVPGLDPEASGLPDSTRIAESLDPDSPIVILDSVTGERVPYWAELDAQAPSGDQALLVRPAVNLREGHRIVVALRGLVDTDGVPIPASTAFTAALEGTPEPEERFEDFARMFDDLRAADIDPASLVLAWDFTVASGDSLQGRALAMRDRALDSLAGGVPSVAVTDVDDGDGVRTIDALVETPNFLSGGSDDGSGPGARLTLDATGLPTIQPELPTTDVPVRCVLPSAPQAPVPVIVYGHGLLGSRAEVDALRGLAASGAVGACALDWIGMSAADIPNLAEILADLSQFPEQADRMLQALLNVQWLARALRAEGGVVALDEFRTVDGMPLVDRDTVEFVGNSQGGILGGAASALTDQWSRAVLGVPGSNYNLLLTRSSNWPRFQPVFESAYIDPVGRLLALELAQLLWDRGENAGYAQHLTADPLPGATAKQVLLIAAYGDHQVANVSTAVLARTIGAQVHRPVVGADRSDAAFALLQDLDALPTSVDDPGAALVVWDYGTPTPPTDNRPPFSPDYGDDPHGAGSSEPGVIEQALTFLLSGRVANACPDGPCVGRQQS